MTKRKKRSAPNRKTSTLESAGSKPACGRDGAYDAVVRSGMFTRCGTATDSLMLILDVTGPDGVFTGLYTSSLEGLEGLSAAFSGGRDFLACCDPSELTNFKCRAVVRGKLGDHARVVTVEPSTETVRTHRTITDLIGRLDERHVETLASVTLARLSSGARRRIALALLATSGRSRVVRTKA